ncbi:iron ABC transporter permease [Sodalis ligni]|uniref:ABC transporter permease n=1 Tax=Sodalis ligni TaxID=2697027 RepID=UPI00193F7E06|nr:iron ABC transporter permease [Sodalis ligni]QWA12973.1 iron ABC transporter permease [Sodalis ligni]
MMKSSTAPAPKQMRPYAGSATLAQKVTGRWRRVAAEPGKIIILTAALLVLGALILYPMARLVLLGLAGDSGAGALRPLINAFSDPGMVKAVGNSALLAVSVTGGSLALGLPMAWLVSRTDMPGKALIRISAAIAFVVPSFITVIAWIFLAAPNSGYLNKLLNGLLGTTTPFFNVISFSGLVFIEIAHLYPLVFFTVCAALVNIDPGYEQAARVLGAGRVRTALHVTLPLVRPAVLSSAILVILDALSSFGAPAAIGTMANFSVITTKIYKLLTFPPHFEQAAALAFPIVVFTLASLLLQRLLIRDIRYRTLSGKAGAKALPVRLGRGRWAAAAFCGTVFFVTAFLPLAALVLLSLLTAFGDDVTFANLTLDHFAMIVDSTFGVFDTVKHSLFLSAGAAFICVILGVLFAWFVERTTIIGRGLVSATIFIAYGFPAITFAVAIMLGYLNWFYGTFTILLIAYVAKQLPISFVLSRSVLKQIAPELEEAARVAGAGWLRTLTAVTLPLLKPSMWAGALLVFAFGLRELTMSAILAQPATQVMSTKVIEYLETGEVEQAAAMALIIVVLSLASLVLYRLVSGGNLIDMKKVTSWSKKHGHD